MDTEPRRTQLQMLEALTDAQLAQQATGWVLMELDLLRDKDYTVHTAWKVATGALDYTERLLSLAAKHEDTLARRQAERDYARLLAEVCALEARWGRYAHQWRRLWSALAAAVEDGDLLR